MDKWVDKIDVASAKKRKVYRTSGLLSLAAVLLMVISLGIRYGVMREGPTYQSWQALGMVGIVLAASWIWTGWVEVCLRTWELLIQGDGLISKAFRGYAMVCGFLCIRVGLAIVSLASIGATVLAPLLVFDVLK